MPRCEACGSKDLECLLGDLSQEYQCNETVSVWRYRLVKCLQCGLGFIDPKLPPDVLGGLYDSTFPYSVPHEHAGRKLECVKWWLAKQRYSPVRGKPPWRIAGYAIGLCVELITGRRTPFTLGLPLQLSKDAAILDLGYGSGEWLLQMSTLGYRNLFGYDIVRVNQARLEAVGVKVTSGNFMQNNYPQSHFDIIRLEHVLEHLWSPVEVLSKCRTMLRPGGWLLITSPSFDSLNMRLSMPHSSSLQLPWHLFHHTPRSASIMLRAAGYEIMAIRLLPVVGQYRATLNNLLVNKWGRKLPSLLFIPLSPFYGLVSTVVQKGDFLTIWARRS